MQINIPDDAVPGLSAQAKAAGFGDVEAYVLNLLMPPQGSVVDHSDIEAAINAGFASGVSEKPIKQFLAELRQKLQAAE